MLSPLSIIFAAALGVPGGCDMWETIILKSVITSGDLKQFGLQVHSADRVAVLVCFD